MGASDTGGSTGGSVRVTFPGFWHKKSEQVKGGQHMQSGALHTGQRSPSNPMLGLQEGFSDTGGPTLATRRQTLLSRSQRWLGQHRLLGSLSLLAVPGAHDSPAFLHWLSTGFGGSRHTPANNVEHSRPPQHLRFSNKEHLSPIFAHFMLGFLVVCLGLRVGGTVGTIGGTGSSPVSISTSTLTSILVPSTSLVIVGIGK